MPNLIIAKDKKTGNFAQISDAWLERFPGEFEKVRDVEDPITEEEKEFEKKLLEQEAAATAAPAEQPSSTEVATDTSTDASTDTSSSRSSRSSY